MAVFAKVLCVFFLNLHPVHVSVMNIDVSTENLKLSYSLRIYADDLEYALIHKYDTLICLTDSLGISNAELSLLKSYLNDNLKISQKDKVLKATLTDMNRESELLWLRYDVRLDNDADTLTVKNTVLFDLFYDQKNLVIVQINNKEYGYTINNKQPSIKLKL